MMNTSKMAASTEPWPQATRFPAEGLWIEDVRVGDRVRTDAYAVTTDAIVEFAKAWDPQPFHLREDTARDTFFQGLAASGWMVASITMRLLVTSGLPLARGIVGAGCELSWPTATRPGDRLYVDCEVTDVRMSRSQPDRGFITLAHDTINERGDLRQRATARVMAFTKAGLGDS